MRYDRGNCLILCTFLLALSARSVMAKPIPEAQQSSTEPILSDFAPIMTMTPSEGEQAVRDAALSWRSAYPISIDCPLAIAARETGRVYDPAARNGIYYAWYQFGPGESTIWSLSRDWIEQRLEPWQVSPAEQTRVLMAIMVQYPVEAASAWAPLLAECPVGAR